MTRADSAAVLLDAARELEARGSAVAADALLRLLLERYPGTPAAAAAGERVAQRLAARRPLGGEEGGRTELLVWGPLYGAWLGVALPLALGSEEPEAVGLGLLIATPAAFFAARAYADATAPSVGQARAVTFGGTWGTWQGIGWQAALDIGEEQFCEPLGAPPEERYCYTETDQEAVFGSGLAGGLAGIGLGAWLASRADITPGTATLVNFGALWGTWYGAVAAVQAGFQDDRDADRLLTTMLLAGDAGLLATAFLAPGWNMSRSRARMINIAGVVGLAAGFGLDLLIQPDDAATVMLIPALTSAAGLVLGATRTRDMDDRADGPGGGAGAGALLEVRGGRLEVGLPVPAPTLLREARPGGGVGRSAGVRVGLFHASF